MKTFLVFLMCIILIFSCKSKTGEKKDTNKKNDIQKEITERRDASDNNGRFTTL